MLYKLLTLATLATLPININGTKQYSVEKAASVIFPNEKTLPKDAPNHVIGTITFEMMDTFETRIYGEISGLKKYGIYELKIYDISSDEHGVIGCESTGPHYNLDFIKANKYGVSNIDIIAPLITLNANQLKLYRDLIDFIHDEKQWKIEDIIQQIEIALPDIFRRINAVDGGEGLSLILNTLYDDISDNNGNMINTLILLLETILDDISVIGHGLVIIDPESSTGNSGGRLACGVIDITKEQKKKIGTKKDSKKHKKKSRKKTKWSTPQPMQVQESTDDCSYILDDNLSDIPTFEVRPELLDQNNDQFPSPPQPEIIKVTKNVYVAIGYDLANTIIIETLNGIIIIDTLSEITSARHVFNDYKLLRFNDAERTHEQMLVQAIILTHYHTDHVNGIGFWLALNIENKFDLVPTIYMNSKSVDQFENFFIYSALMIANRSARQFGTLMHNYMDQQIVDKNNLFINSGIGPHVNKQDNSTLIFDLKAKNVKLIKKEEFKFKVNNVKLLLIYAPGETNDGIAIWFENRKVLLIGDNFYYAFPNIYSIRGTKARDPNIWINSLDKLLKYDAKYLIGSHSKPIYGTDKIQNELKLYRDIISFIHDQSVRYIQKEWKIEDIIEEIQITLPNIFKQGRTQEFYGTIEWSIRGIYNMYLGWFQGDSSQLYPSNDIDRGEGLSIILNTLYDSNDYNNYNRNMIDTLILLFETLLNEAEKNKDDSQYIHVILDEERWILEIVSALATYYKECDEIGQCNEWLKLAKLRWKIMQNIAGRSISTNGRNYLITQFLEERYKFDQHMSFTINENYLLLPIEWILDSLRFRVRVELIIISLKIWKTNLKFIDSGLMFQLTLRNGGVLSIEEYSTFSQEIIQQYDNNAALIYQMNEIDFKLGNVNDMTYVVKGTILNIIDFWARFEPPQMDITSSSTKTEINVNDKTHKSNKNNRRKLIENHVNYDYWQLISVCKRDFVFICIGVMLCVTFFFLFFFFSSFAVVNV